MTNKGIFYLLLNIFGLLIAFEVGAIPQSPTVYDLTPTNGPVGTVVTIYGDNLLNPTSLTIGGVEAVVISNNGVSIVALVMPGSATGSVRISTAGGTDVLSNAFTVTTTLVPNTQQGTKLVGAGAVGAADQGRAVAVSADGNTAIVGGPLDNDGRGAAWIFSRVAGSWVQQGPKLVATDAIGAANLGVGVALSADGNTALVGGWFDNSDQGAAWVFTRSASSSSPQNIGLLNTEPTWTQQAKLVGIGVDDYARQGLSVALSADGNTAAVGGRDDDFGIGAVWVFSRLGSTWSQQGPKLRASDGVGILRFGQSVSLSASGNTLAVGGNGDFGTIGATWIFTRTINSWSQQGNKLVGSGATFNPGPEQGRRVALNADGKILITGGPFDSNSTGASWVFSLVGGQWTQQGNKLVGSGALGATRQGVAVSSSGDGNILASSGPLDNGSVGATWLFTRNGQGWSQSGNKLVATGGIGASQQGFYVAISSNASTMIIGGPGDDGGKGAVWVFSDPSSTTSTEADQVSDKASLRLFPNPIARSQRLTLALPDRAAASLYTVEFIDLAGRVALTQRGELAAGASEALMLSVSALAPGTYAVRYTSGGVVTTGRVVITE